MVMARTIRMVTGLMARAVGATLAVATFLHPGELVGKASPAFLTTQVRQRIPHVAWHPGWVREANQITFLSELLEIEVDRLGAGV
jgi:hypothetical protein